MSLLDELRARIPERIRKNGEPYVEKGFITIDVDTETFLAGTVNGSRAYATSLEWRGTNLVLSCDCAAFEDFGQCKHLWALGVLADQQGARIAARSTSVDAQPSMIEKKGKPAEKRHLSQRGSSDAAQPGREQSRKGQRKRLIYLISEERPDSSTPRFRIEAIPEVEASDGRWIRGLRHRLFLYSESDDIKEVDREILRLLEPMSPPSSTRSIYLPSPESLSKERFERFLPKLKETGRLFWAERHGAQIHVSPREDEQWNLEIGVRPSKLSERFLLMCCLTRGDERRCLHDFKVTSTLGFGVIEGRLVRLANAPAIAFAQEYATRFGGHRKEHDIDAAELERMLVILDAVSSRVEVRIDPALPHAGRPDVRVEVLSPDPRATTITAFQVRIHFEYATASVPFESNANFFDRRSGLAGLRDFPEEARGLGLFQQLGGILTNYGGEPTKAWIPASVFSTLVPTLTSAGWRVLGSGSPYRRLTFATTRIVSGIDWFDLEIDADFEGYSAETPELLKAARERHRTVRLIDGSHGLMPDEWSGRWGVLKLVGTPSGGKLRVSRDQAWLLDAVVDDLPKPAFDSDFADVRERLRSAGTPKAEDAPPGFQGELRGYQHESLGWFRFLREVSAGGCLADDMGLGKTVQVLALLLARQKERGTQKPSLVVAPRSLIFNWKAEAARFTPSLKVLDWSGPTSERQAALPLNADLVLTTYGLLRTSVESLSTIDFDYVVLDESTAIKNALGQTSKAARSLKGQHRLALSGTPVENHLGELWALFEFLNPGLLGRSSIFTEVLSADGGLEADRQLRSLLGKALRPFILRRTKGDVAKELPPKLEQVISCELEPAQRKDYDSVRDHYRAALLPEVKGSGLSRMQIQVLEALLRLRQTACHPGLIDKGRAKESSAKLEVLSQHLQEALEGGHKCLVFSQFVSFLDIVEHRLQAQKIGVIRLDGRTKDRQARVERFQSKDGPSVFLISLKAGGVGLNLTSADYVFILDPWWNPAAEAQAADRAHRMGQTRQVFVYRLVAKDTIEEKILELQTRKRELVSSILDSSSTSLRDLSAEDLALLLA